MHCRCCFTRAVLFAGAGCSDGLPGRVDWVGCSGGVTRGCRARTPCRPKPPRHPTQVTFPSVGAGHFSRRFRRPLRIRAPILRRSTSVMAYPNTANRIIGNRTLAKTQLQLLICSGWRGKSYTQPVAMAVPSTSSMTPTTFCTKPSVTFEMRREPP